MKSSVNTPRRLVIAIGEDAMEPAEGEGTSQTPYPPQVPIALANGAIDIEQTLSN